ncbi:hypothetical protein BG011_007212 [Mortierella polycephala]|uniref:Glycosyltransferase 61 catalytic domain-containing protein n=1 Tax=Mortierella polycephala TaxID=41804 RepID=A0A9P6TYY2_9FUNG|nr:hypothetical protein BG011_007212 [Mortierella polycephala]
MALMTLLCRSQKRTIVIEATQSLKRSKSQKPLGPVPTTTYPRKKRTQSQTDDPVNQENLSKKHPKGQPVIRRSRVGRVLAAKSGTLLATMKRFGATKNSWTFRNGRFAYDDVKLQGRWEMEHFFPTGKELVLSQYELATDFQTLPPSDAPICFKRAVIGLGSQCALSYCEKNIPTEVYQSFREELSEYYWDKPETWSKHLTTSRDAIEKDVAKAQAQQTSEDRQQDLKKSDKSPLKCLDLARYYNFEGVSEGHSLEQGEKPNRVGQQYPDTADPEENYRNEYQQPSTPDNNTQGESKRQLVVGIIQREKSRKVINDQDLIMGLVQAGFRVKWMSFDHGCGLAETAYLLRDVNVLISPHGNAIGTSVFMPNDAVPTIISVDNSRYRESNYVDDAAKERCPLYKDLEGGAKVLQNAPLVLGLPPSMIKTDADKKLMSFEERQQMIQHNREYVASHADARALAYQELEEMIQADVSSALVGKYGEDIWSFYANFWKAIPRYVDVPRVVKFVQGLQADSDQEKESGKAVGKYEHFINYVRKSQACGSEICTDILERNVADDTSAFGQHSIDNVALWGQPTLESAKLRVGVKDVKDWQFDVQL